MPTAISYIRFSSKKQEGNDSIRRQAKLATQWCETNNHDLSDLKFQDLGVSAFRGKHRDSQLGALVDALKEGAVKADVLLVENIDRLSRELPLEATAFITNLATLINIEVLDEREPLSLNKGAQESELIKLTLAIGRSHRESAVKSNRVSKSIANKYSNPQESKKFGQRPMWLDLSEDKKTYLPNKHIEVIQRIFELRLQGLGVVRIGSVLNSEGFVPPRRKSWVRSPYISLLLKDRRLLGEAIHRGETIKDYYPTVIDSDLFNLVQAKLITAKSTSNKGASRTKRNIVKGIGVCKCGAPIRFMTNGGNAYLQCSAAIEHRCSTKTFRIDYFYKFLSEQLINPDLYHARWSTSTEELEALEKQQALLAVQKDKISKETRAQFKGFSEQLIQGAIAEKLEVLEAEVSELNAQIAKVRGGDTVKQDLQNINHIIDLAHSDNHEDANIIARDKLNTILLGFSDLCLWSEDKVSHIVLTDSVKTMTFRTPKNPAKAYKTGANIWNLIDTAEIEK